MRRALVRLAIPELVLAIPVLVLTAACSEDPVAPSTPLTITGTVSEHAAPGAPMTVVAGADVRFAVPAAGEESQWEPQWVETTTDASGNYELEIEAPAGCAATDSAYVRYEAEAAGYVPFSSMLLSKTQTVSCGSAPQEFDIGLQPEG